MCRKSLPLNALRAFEAAARHNSYARAAEELSVSPAAIHHHVKLLSEQLGIELFYRNGRSLRLSKAGRACWASLEHGFDMLSLAIEQARAYSTSGLVKVTSCPSFATKWLTPRLGGFNSALPTVELQLRTSSELIDLNEDDSDLIIHYGKGTYDGLHVEFLGEEELVAVCSPMLLSAETKIVSNEQISDYRLIHDDSLAREPGHPDWSDWFVQANISSNMTLTGYHFETSSLAIDAAATGLGVALCPRILVSGEVAAGRLVEFSPVRLPTGRGYFLLSLPSVADQPKISALREWILTERSRPLSSRDKFPKASHRPARDNFH